MKTRKSVSAILCLCLLPLFAACDWGDKTNETLDMTACTIDIQCDDLKESTVDVCAINYGANETYCRNVSIFEVILHDSDGDKYLAETSAKDACEKADLADKPGCEEAVNVSVVSSGLSYGDCDDNDPNVYVGAPEIFDGKDDNCDGQLAEGECATAATCPASDACTTAATCTEFHCVAGTPITLDDGNACTLDACDPVTGPSHEPILNCCLLDSECTDDDACNGVETCTDNLCVPGTPPNCDSGDLCTIDSCDPLTGCAHTAIPNCCRDDSECPATDTCVNLTCVPVACVANDACDIATIDPTTRTCVHTVKANCCLTSAICLDNQYCNTTSHLCEAVLCGGGTFCEAIVVKNHDCVIERKPDGTACGDATVCNGTETCQAGTCAAGTPLILDDGNVCTLDACDPVTGVSHTAIPNCCTTDTQCNSALYQECISNMCGVRSCTVDADCVGTDFGFMWRTYQNLNTTCTTDADCIVRDGEYCTGLGSTIKHCTIGFWHDAETGVNYGCSTAGKCDATCVDQDSDGRCSGSEPIPAPLQSDWTFPSTVKPSDLEFYAACYSGGPEGNFSNGWVPLPTTGTTCDVTTSEYCFVVNDVAGTLHFSWNKTGPLFSMCWFNMRSKVDFKWLPGWDPASTGGIYNPATSATATINGVLKNLVVVLNNTTDPSQGYHWEAK